MGIDNATNHTSGRAAASLTSTAMTVATDNERVLQDEEECEPRCHPFWMTSIGMMS